MHIEKNVNYYVSWQLTFDIDMRSTGNTNLTILNYYKNKLLLYSIDNNYKMIDINSINVSKMLNKLKKPPFLSFILILPNNNEFFSKFLFWLEIKINYFSQKQNLSAPIK